MKIIFSSKYLVEVYKCIFLVAPIPRRHVVSVITLSGLRDQENLRYYNDNYVLFRYFSSLV